MTQLEHSQWIRLNQFTLELHSESTEEHFFRCCLELMPKVLDIPFLGWDDFDADLNFLSCHWSEGYDTESDKIIPLHSETMARHPVVLSLGLREKHQALEKEYAVSGYASDQAFRYLDVKYQLYTELSFNQHHRCGIVINSDNKIKQEQRTMVELMRPHLVTAYRNVLRYEANVPEIYLDPQRMDMILKLAPRFRRTLTYLLQGYSRKMIADKMDLSIHTLNDYVREIYSKLGVHSHAELISMFRPDAGGVKK